MGQVFSVDPGLPFLDVIATAISQRYVSTEDPLAATDITVLLPTRRACRALRTAFLQTGAGRAVLLPKILPLGDVSDEDGIELELPGESGLVRGPRSEALDIPPAIGGLTRRLILTRLVLAKDSSLTEDQALRLASDLGRLLDRVQAERLSWDRLDTLVPESLSDHWQQALTFLHVLSKVWPEQLALLGAIDPGTRQDALLRLRADQWRAHPPGPVIVAGSTGSIPATADLLKMVAELPQGWVVLPGLDREMPESDWTQLEESHPQYGMMRLCHHLGIDRQAVGDVPGSVRPDPASLARTRLVAEALRPAVTTDRWASLPPLVPAALDGLVRLNASGPRQEAGTIALIIREALETPERTVALVTPDRSLARRVVASLDRWNITVDDSAGTPLSATSVGRLLRHAAAAAADGFSPNRLLTLLGHPLVGLGLDPLDNRRLVRLLDRHVLRGPRPDPGLDTVLALTKAAALQSPSLEVLLPWLTGLADAAAPLTALMALPSVAAADLLDAHMRFCEDICAAKVDGVAQAGALRLWAGDAGEAAVRFVVDLADGVLALEPIAPQRYPAVFDAALEGAVVRPQRDLHARVFVWGPLEARLLRPDIMILGGLNEDSWPAAIDTGPWMSRPMMKAFGLPAPERRIGLAAHDFAQAVAAPTVVLSRAERVDGTPTRPSRWLRRLDAVAEAAGLKQAMEMCARRGARWQTWAEALDQPLGPVSPCARPAPRPPVADRPRKLPVTDIELWHRDPYGLYAKRLLALRALEPCEADPSGREYGTLIHDILDRFAKDWPRELPDDPVAVLRALGKDAFAPVLHQPGVRAFWWPRFLGIAAWMAALEQQRRPSILKVHTEIEGVLELEGPAGPFRLFAQADRIEEKADGTLAIIDHKTGTIPGPNAVDTGYAPQLPLEAAIAASGGFDGIPAKPVSELLFWKPRGDRKGGEVRVAAKDPMEAARIAREGLSNRILAFDRLETPYRAVPHPEHAPKYNDYQHLARMREWSGQPEPKS